MPAAVGSAGFFLWNFRVTLRRRHSFQFAPWLIFAALLFRALLPDGFMLERNAAGNIALEICHASALAGLRHDAGAPATAHAVGDDCVFAAAATPALPGGAYALPQILSAAPVLVAAQLARAPIRFSGGRPRARAPPVLT